MVRTLKRLDLFCLLLSFLLTQSLSGNEPESQVKSASYEVNKILDLSVDSPITPAVFSYLTEAYDYAIKTSHQMVLIRMNTPGGLVSTTKEILSLIGDSRIPTVIWITPEGASATSAGAIISSGAHQLYMSGGTNIGAATPILPGGKDETNKDLKSKAVNDLVALVESLSQLRGRNPEHYAEMIKEASSYSSKQALEKNIVDGVVSTQNDLFEAMNGRLIVLKGKKLTLSMNRPELTSFEMDLGQILLNIMSDPNFAYILFILGAALIYFELQAPGTFIAGSLGVACLILSGIGFHILPVNFGAFGLIILSFVLLILEAFVTSFGLLSLAGIASLVTGSLFLFRTDEAYIEVSRLLIASVSLSVGLFIAAMGLFWFKDAQKNRVQDNYYSMEGMQGTVVHVLKGGAGELHRYQIKISGEVWNALSESEYEEGDTCVVKNKSDGDLNLMI